MSTVEGSSKFRELSGPARLLERTLLVALTLLGASWALEIHHAFPWTFFKEQYLGLFLALALAIVFLSVKERARAPGHRVPGYDWCLSLGGLAAGLYVVARYPTIAYQLGVVTWDKVLLGGLAIVLVLEATRRLVGWVMVGLGALFILYAKFAYLFPGLLYARGSSWERIAVYLYLDTNGLLGLPLAVTASIVVAFIFFGQVLYAAGGDKFLTDLALVAMGRYRGGPAKVSVAASSLFGTVSGSAVSNVVVDGAITIPMMKRTGYAPHMAAAIEAVASTGGQIMPPVMGVAAFLIAEFLAIPYSQVALAAVVPALLYYLALFVQVDLEAAKHGLVGLPAAELPRLREVMRRGWSFLVPLGVLIYTLMIATWQAGKAGMAAVIATLLVGALQREDGLTARKLLTAIEETARVLLDIVVITAVAGFVIGVLQLSGLGFKFSLVLVNVAGGNALALLILTAAVCIILGMGMPTAIVYIMLAVLVGPALVQLGISALGAHLFLFYFGMLSMITPPVCLATYAAASIGRADFMKTGWAGMRLGIVAYVVPFVFAYHPALLLTGSATEITLAVGTAVIGVVLLGVGCAGYLFRPLGWGKRAWTSLAGLLLIPPPASGAWLIANFAGLALGGLLVLVEWAGTAPAPAARDARAPRAMR
ncbi:MAG: TRAP transporter fused permease subunit [Candidatus Rokubacteria bacterium]|nr:TRAP transporter fused permease subunit [Candidatus Rokubacteria bacterium]